MARPRLTPQELKLGLAEFHGTEQWFRHSLCRNVLYTEGVQYLAENADCYWLIDKIATLQRLPQIRATGGFQRWKMTLLPGSGALLTADDGDGNVVWQERIDWTDFPLDETNILVEGDADQPVILLPGEH